ncbi:alpha/beta hydrolase [Amycolatopsis pigmentata]|uniref:Alpha/beta hydrolase n=1 Tax=Amycolatopsis pigmentata TaxID=450801 RepID=A0ABW5G534_9PSEU
MFIHGGFHGWWAWEIWQSHFAELGWCTYAISLPGHTDSKQLPDSDFVALDLSDYARAVGELLGWLNEPPVLVGHSMGGIVAQMVAQHANPRALVLVASGRTRKGDEFRPDFPLGKPVVIKREEARKEFFHVIDDDWFDQLFQRLCPESPAALNDVTRGGAIKSAEFECPVLVLTAERDRGHVSELADYATRTYRATRAVVLNAGHDLILDPTSSVAATYVHAWLVTHIPTALPAIQVTAQGQDCCLAPAD